MSPLTHLGPGQNFCLSSHVSFPPHICLHADPMTLWQWGSLLYILQPLEPPPPPFLGVTALLRCPSLAAREGGGHALNGAGRRPPPPCGACLGEGLLLGLCWLVSCFNVLSIIPPTPPKMPSFTIRLAASRRGKCLALSPSWEKGCWCKLGLNLA